MRSHLLCCNSIASNYPGVSETRTRLILLNYGLDGEITGWSSMVHALWAWHQLYYVNYTTKTITYLFFPHSKIPNVFHTVHFRKICSPTPHFTRRNELNVGSWHFLTSLNCSLTKLQDFQIFQTEPQSPSTARNWSAFKYS